MSTSSIMVRSGALGLFAALMLAVVAHAQGDPASPLDAVQLSPVSMELLPALQRATDVGGASPDQVLHIAVSLPFAHPSAVQSFVGSVSDPRSQEYGHFLVPEEIGERFGLSTSQVESVADHLRRN